jgi:hypothetical protein
MLTTFLSFKSVLHRIYLKKYNLGTTYKEINTRLTLIGPAHDIHATNRASVLEFKNTGLT